MGKKDGRDKWPKVKLKNILIVVDDIGRSKNFYCRLFGLRVVTDFGGNVILTEGLVLQERKLWEGLIGGASVHGGNDAELYFEENDMDAFMRKLEEYPEPVKYLQQPVKNKWGKRTVRIVDPDGHMIEIGEAVRRTWIDEEPKVLPNTMPKAFCSKVGKETG